MKAAAIITDGLEPISSKAERPSPAVQKAGRERSRPEICGNVISYRRDDSQPDGSIELCHDDDDVNWARTAFVFRPTDNLQQEHRVLTMFILLLLKVS